MISRYGKHFINHKVTTKDGYILSLFEYNNPNKNEIKKENLIIQHGLQDSSDFITQTPSGNDIIDSLSCKYRLWLPNSRGNKYSMENTGFSNKNDIFWDFSFQEMGKYDIPAVIDHIQNESKNQNKLAYIGVSQGTALMTSALTDNLQYFQEKLGLYVAVVPVFDSKKSLIPKYEMKNIQFHEKAGKYNISPPGKLKKAFFSRLFTKYPQIVKHLLKNFTDKNPDFDIHSINDFSEFIANYLLSGCSLKCYSHFSQILLNKKFQAFDYGPIKNIKIYGQSDPPLFDTKLIKGIPIAIFAGEDDLICNIDDVKEFRDSLSENVIYFKSYANAGHSIFWSSKDLWFSDFTSLLLDRV